MGWVRCVVRDSNRRIKNDLFFPNCQTTTKKKKKRTEDVLAFRLTFFFWRFGLGLVVRTQATSDEQRTPKSLGQNVNVDVDRGNDKYRKQVQDGRRTCLFDFVCLWLWFLDSVLLASYSLVARNPCNEKECGSLWLLSSRFDFGSGKCVRSFVVVVESSFSSKKDTSTRTRSHTHATTLKRPRHLPVDLPFLFPYFWIPFPFSGTFGNPHR